MNNFGSAIEVFLLICRKKWSESKMFALRIAIWSDYVFFVPYQTGTDQYFFESKFYGDRKFYFGQYQGALGVKNRTI